MIPLSIQNDLCHLHVHVMLSLMCDVICIIIRTSGTGHPFFPCKTVPLKAPFFASQNVEAILARSEQVMGICQGILNGEMISPALLPAAALTATAVERLQVEKGIGIRIRIESGFSGVTGSESRRGRKMAQKNRSQKKYHLFEVLDVLLPPPP
jgi:hypothetical protein